MNAIAAAPLHEIILIYCKGFAGCIPMPSPTFHFHQNSAKTSSWGWQNCCLTRPTLNTAESTVCVSPEAPYCIDHVIEASTDQILPDGVGVTVHCKSRFPSRSCNSKQHDHQVPLWFPIFHKPKARGKQNFCWIACVRWCDFSLSTLPWSLSRMVGLRVLILNIGCRDRV